MINKFAGLQSKDVFVMEHLIASGGMTGFRYMKLRKTQALHEFKARMKGDDADNINIRGVKNCVFFGTRVGR